MSGHDLYSDAGSGLILALHRGADGRDAAAFPAWAMAEVGKVIPFDGACWLSGSEDGARVRDRCLLGWPGRDAEWLAADCATARRRQFGIHAEIVATRCEVHTTLYDSLSLYRSTTAAAFSESDQALLSLLLPQLVAARRRNMLYALQTPQCAAASDGGAYAICDAQGMLHRANEGFTGLMLLELPQWQGPWLPWREQLAAARQRRLSFKGNEVVVHARRAEGLFHLRARRRTPLDELSPAELRVARELAGGASYKAAARHLGLSPSTVNNHAAIVYRKLGVHDKVALAMRWRELGEAGGGRS
jgi:DNA-binding CsgD family transcriptional regulator